VSAPWTQTISLSWRPELRYYEERIAILRQLEDRGDLRAFRVRDEAIDARLFDRDHQLSVRQDGLTLQLLRPSADPEQAWSAVALAVAAIRPSKPTKIMVGLQHLEAIPLAFEDAVRHGREHLTSVPLAGDVHG
jgi:hypothetical protein